MGDADDSGSDDEKDKVVGQPLAQALGIASNPSHLALLSNGLAQVRNCYSTNTPRMVGIRAGFDPVQVLNIPTDRILCTGWNISTV
jgi:hypothetical protein